MKPPHHDRVGHRDLERAQRRLIAKTLRRRAAARRRRPGATARPTGPRALIRPPRPGWVAEYLMKNGWRQRSAPARSEEICGRKRFTDSAKGDGSIRTG